ncbi:uncharacterized protein LOC111247654 isoform X2 [Varroa destructor]|uniref:Phospholipase A2 n=1 Tax=Varroa destructor TaxID=109461 RepID=A0A7M7JMX1_VARDE|nr:uncharacterized protein LOC111247654 isoform X2 [Varroa destructor]
MVRHKKRVLPNGKISVRLKPPPDKSDVTFFNASLVTHTLSSDFLHTYAAHMYGALNLHSNGQRGNGIVIADSPLHRSHSRKKRSVLQLASMLKCVSGCSPLAFHGYGCFCGYMGDGSPVDPIDSCCLEHDWCYSSTQCSHVATYFLPYDWSCDGPGYAYCGFSDSASPHARCGQQLCECDVAFAKCISRYPCPNHRAGCRQGRSLLRRLFGGKR